MSDVTPAPDQSGYALVGAKPCLWQASLERSRPPRQLVRVNIPPQSTLRDLGCECSEIAG